MDSIHPKTMIGHVHLKVSDLERSVEFYTKVLGFQLVIRMGSSAAFLSAGGYHHHIGLNTWESEGGNPPPAGMTGLYHFAILLPDRKELAKALKRLMDNEWPLEGASDHLVSEALYIRDPDENGIELYRDRAPEEWPRDEKGNILMDSLPLDIHKLLKELE